MVAKESRLITFDQIIPRQREGLREFVFGWNKRGFGETRKPWREVTPNDFTSDVLVGAAQDAIIYYSLNETDYSPSKERLALLRQAYDMSLEDLFRTAGKSTEGNPPDKQLINTCTRLLESAVGIIVGGKFPVWGALARVSEQLGISRSESKWG